MCVVCVLYVCMCVVGAVYVCGYMSSEIISDDFLCSVLFMCEVYMYTAHTQQCNTTLRRLYAVNAVIL